MTAVPCVSCVGTNVSLIGGIPAAINFAGRVLPAPLFGGNLLRCHKCGITFRYPRLQKDELAALYRQADVEHWGDASETRRDWNIARGWLSSHLSRVTHESKVLDVGCWTGEFLRSI